MTMIETARVRTKKDVLTPEHTQGIARVLPSYFKVFKDHNPRSLGNEIQKKVQATIGTFERPKPHPAIVETAINLATEAHSKKGEIETKDYSKRKFSDDPYIVHPLRVALLATEIAEAMGVPVTTRLVVGALLHDVPENNHGYTQEAIATVFAQFDEEIPGISVQIAEDAESLNHFKPNKIDRYDTETYTTKIKTFGTTQDDEVQHLYLLYRKIIKAADRIDNLLDPLNMPEDPNLAIALSENRTNYNQRTKSPNGMIQLLLSDEPFLLELVEIVNRISELTLTNPEFFTVASGN